MNLRQPFTLNIEPASGPLSLRRSITVCGARPGAIVTVKSSTVRNGVNWSTRASYLADERGQIDLDKEAPVFGRFRVADAMGLLWAQTASQSSNEDAQPLPESVFEPVVTSLTAWCEPGTGVPECGEVTSDGYIEAELVQELLPGDVKRCEIRQEGLVGTLFTPAGVGPYPTIIVMNGSGGGINEVRAAQYAAHGIQAFALGYFRVGGKSHYISRTPLEYFETALNYVNRELAPLGGRTLVSGQSRGGELTLLLASKFPEKIGAIIAFVPSSFLFGAQGAANPKEGWSGPAWTWRGEPLEHLWHDNSEVTWQPWDAGPHEDPDRDVYLEGLRNHDLAADSRIPIEKFGGPVLCVSGMDDRAWPSSLFSRLALGALEAAGHKAERLHLDYESAGHSIGVPFLPTSRIEVRHPVSKVPYSNGGTPYGNALASERSFDTVCDFTHRVSNRLV